MVDPPAPFDVEKFEWPEKLDVTDEDKKALGALAEKHKISADAVKDILGTHTAVLQRVVDGLTSAQSIEWNKQVEGFGNETRKIYGARLDEVTTNCEKVLDEFGSQALRDQLIATGLGNHPAVFQFIEKIYKAIGEGKPVNPGTQAAPESALNKMYPTMKPKE